MSDFPEAILVPKNYEDKGNPFTENDQINTSSEIVLQHYAQLRTVRSDGTVIASSVSVNYNGQVYTEIFTSPVPASNYFYSYDDPTQQTTILLFNSAQSQSISLQVNYITRGD